MSLVPSAHRRIRSVFETTPITLPSESMTGAPEISCSSNTRANSRIVADGSRRWWDFALCGLTSAFVTTNELPAAAFGLAMFVLLLRADWRRTLVSVNQMMIAGTSAVGQTTGSFKEGAWHTNTIVSNAKMAAGRF